MLNQHEQMKEWDRVVAMCKGTKFEGREYLCIKFLDGAGNYAAYSGVYMPDLSGVRIRIFAVAIVDNTPIWLEEPFNLYSKDRDDLVFKYDEDRNSLVGVTDYPVGTMLYINFIKIIIPIANVIWKSFTITKPSKVSEIDCHKVDSKQVGGTHYKDKAIQPWAYMEANFTKEEFVGFLRGNALKYLDRYKDKNGVEDLKKAIHYIEKLIQVENK